MAHVPNYGHVRKCKRYADFKLSFIQKLIVEIDTKTFGYATECKPAFSLQRSFTLSLHLDQKNFGSEN